MHIHIAVAIITVVVACPVFIKVDSVVLEIRKVGFTYRMVLSLLLVQFCQYGLTEYLKVVFPISLVLISGLSRFHEYGLMYF